MDAALFDYELPPDRIAQHPIRPRDHSRLLVVGRTSCELTDCVFRDILHFLRPGDILVLNNTKVFRAKLSGNRADTGGAIDVLLLKERDEGVWEALVKPGRKAKEGAVVSFGKDSLRARIAGRTDFGGRVFDFTVTPNFARASFARKLGEIGEVPLPPYIKSSITDDELYQTVYATETGSVAAPTAGFHFTEGLLAQVKALGVDIAQITLHVGLGTFRPVKTERIEDHVMHEEHFAVPEAAAWQMRDARRGGGRIVAVGTTVLRALESCPDNGGAPTATSGWTSVYITPGYRFRFADALVTNFHLPRTSLLILVSAFAGRDSILSAYRHAVDNGYRFYSFGDAMLIV
ncbi:MAG: tRNA preQ1(34) S-adenosylmethionine ribosyltransferase-isomerase QueA [Armatimonadetes bacterium CG2_30_59_28]|nr:tRNA preQ1(34) S-adenosylmethionine ribosyltransferase-isomerase QueA [Armatimonadota bacterium]OIO94034.1 MAG: tRNA preQ1(34) S-adenosylmethionine ribosyltransferase-isomerase QueA [Armatimonadetes bacterium CG2_30_59_28]PIU62021.1 MAG: tRNA preQ1(34) S-adenosylmethionine ribosyltransferase-isomerase QueA [Armatimonadetes bacterium CG07_land_8_20_14_0_80_59_28]PIX39471.1 MAG: tRNA preQ1(34) S-adenosylmethionine ribosyltransferase-isomerase QueA [Armatimonadetes bacterium CG_4_8_14_3_um_filte